jgi:crotonobetainyl-CoA:carnitine CoA-transferase CaiB-like acyl-CoA transferase
MPQRSLQALHSLLNGVDWRDAPVDMLQITPAANMLPTILPIGPMATAAIGATGLIAATLRQMRGGRSQRVGIDMRAATLAMTSAPYLRVNGQPVKSWDPITGYYATRDGWAYLHGNFAHLRDGLLQLFDVPNDPAALGTALTTWSATDVEQAAGERGLCAVAVRNTQAWTAHPQAQATALLPLIEITRIGDAPPRPAGNGTRPLSGLRVLDLTRVIAGPMAGRTLAEHGATVMLVTAPHLPSIESLVIDTGFGKHAISADLNTAEGLTTLRRLAGSADVFLNSYRPGALAGRGFSAQNLAALRPGIVCVNISAFSRAGPWAARRGYDTLVAAATGLTWNGETAVRPARLPCQPLDYLTGYLAAFGAMLALRRRALEGGSWEVTLSLERTAAWIREMAGALGYENDQPAQVPADSEIDDLYAEQPSVFGQLRFLRPVVQLAATPAGWDRAPVPLGSDAAQWPNRPL